jgi:hypothetical protein
MIILRTVPRHLSQSLAGGRRVSGQRRQLGDAVRKGSVLAVRIDVQHADALTFKADVLAVKYADKLYGLDRAVVSALGDVGLEIKDRLPKPLTSYITPTNGSIASDHVLFVGVGPLYNFRYREIRTFARKVLEALAVEMPETRNLALTIHGPNYGLDESEAFESELAGLFEASIAAIFPPPSNK